MNSYRNTSIIITNYNTKDILKDCIVNLLNLNEAKEILVIDNDSKDGSADMVKTEFVNNPEVKLFALDKNTGLSYAGNVGLENSTGKYLLYLGSDAFPKPGTISGMEKYFDEVENSKVGAATAKLVLRDGTLDMDAHRGFPTPFVALVHFSGIDKLFKQNRTFDKYFLGYEDLSKPHEIDLGISHFMMIRREVFNKIGKWDEDYFVFGEDVDMCYRIKQSGWKIMYLPQFEAVHYKGASVGIRKESADISPATAETKIHMMNMKAKGMETFYAKHYKKKYPWILNTIVLTGIRGLNLIRMMKIKATVFLKG
jgi:GT2 family glycosyltransferase